MNNNIKNAFTKTLLAFSIAGASSVSHAASFALIEQSASGQGSAYAGAAALGEDASTIFFNPAGMTRLSGQQVVVRQMRSLPMTVRLMHSVRLCQDPTLQLATLHLCLIFITRQHCLTIFMSASG